MMRNISIRQWVHLLMGVLALTALVSFYGVRLTTKGAQFHHLEREYAVNLQKLSHTLANGADGKLESRDELMKALRYSAEISRHVDTDLLRVEQGVFRMMGYGMLIDLPHESIRKVHGMLDRLALQPGDYLSVTMARALAPETDDLIRQGEAFAQGVAAAVALVGTMVWVSMSISVIAMGLLVWQMGKAIVGPLEHAKAMAVALSSGDLAGEGRSTYPVSDDEVGALTQAMQQMQSTLSDVVRQVSQCSEGVVTGSAEIASGGLDLSQRTEMQAGQLQQASADLSRLNEMVKGSAEAARAANVLASNANDAAKHGHELMQLVVQTMQDIASASSRIDRIVGVIDGIAFQTNLLALNASVEAARAGEHGRGFAVVADEVRTLASRAAASAKEIKGLIGSSAQSVGQGERLVGEAGRSMQHIEAEIAVVRERIQQISTMIGQQETGMASIASAIEHLDDATQQNAALVEQSAAASQSLKAQAMKLGESISFFKMAA